MNSPLRILILTSGTGGGHNARAEAFRAWVQKLYGWSVDVRIECILENSSPVSRFGVFFYNTIQKYAPWIHHPYYSLLELFKYWNRRGVVFGAHYYEELLRNFQPHLVFSVHDFCNRGYFQTARSILGANRVRCATYCSEFSGGYGYSANWIEPSVDLYISRTKTAADYAVKLGLPRQRILVRGHLMDPRVYEEVLTSETRREYRKQRLGLNPDKFTLFLATGGTGANNHLKILPILARHAEWLQVVVVCGRNHQAYLKCMEWHQQNPNLECHIEGYCQEMHLFIQASDAIITRGGTTTCAKALHFRCPILFNGFGGIMPQELLTVKYFRQGNGAELIRTPGDLHRILKRWHTYPKEYDALIRRMDQLRYEENPHQVVHELVALGKTVLSGVEHPLPLPPQVLTV